MFDEKTLNGIFASAIISAASPEQLQQALTELIIKSQKTKVNDKGELQPNGSLGSTYGYSFNTPLLDFAVDKLLGRFVLDAINEIILEREDEIKQAVADVMLGEMDSISTSLRDSIENIDNIEVEVLLKNQER